MKHRTLYQLLALVLTIFLLTGCRSLQLWPTVVIKPNEQGVVISPGEPNGYRPETLKPGTYQLRPGERVIIYDLSPQTYTMTDQSSSAGGDSTRSRTLDGQEVYVDTSVVYSIDPEKVLFLHSTWQNRYEEGVVRAITRGIIRDVASTYTADDLINTKRADAETAIFEAIQSSFEENGLIANGFSILDIRLGTK